MNYPILVAIWKSCRPRGIGFVHSGHCQNDQSALQPFSFHKKDRYLSIKSVNVFQDLTRISTIE